LRDLLAAHFVIKDEQDSKGGKRRIYFAALKRAPTYSKSALSLAVDIA
jgi:hypothetical protein